MVSQNCLVFGKPPHIWCHKYCESHTCFPVFTAVLFTVARTWKQLNAHPQRNCLLQRTDSDSMLEPFLWFAFCCSCYYRLLDTLVIIIIHNGLPQRILLSAWLLKCIRLAHREIIWPCPPVNRRDSKGIPLFLKAGPFPKMFCKTADPFYFTSSLPFPL